jgi:hypothetical protein
MPVSLSETAVRKRLRAAADRHRTSEGSVFTIPGDNNPDAELMHGLVDLDSLKYLVRNLGAFGFDAPLVPSKATVAPPPAPPPAKVAKTAPVVAPPKKQTKAAPKPAPAAPVVVVDVDDDDEDAKTDVAPEAPPPVRAAPVAPPPPALEITVSPNLARLLEISPTIGGTAVDPTPSEVATLVRVLFEKDRAKAKHTISIIRDDKTTTLTLKLAPDTPFAVIERCVRFEGISREYDTFRRRTDGAAVEAWKRVRAAWAKLLRDDPRTAASAAAPPPPFVMSRPVAVLFWTLYEFDTRWQETEE